MNEPKLVRIESTAVAGISVRTSNKDEFEPNTAKLGAFWTRFFTDNIPATITDALPNSPIYGIYSDYESNESGHYTVTAGVAVNDSTAQLEFSQVIIPAGEYLVFSAQGNMPAVVISLWQQIWTYFSQKSHYKRRFDVDFEQYLGPDDIAIYIGVAELD